ncbi:hypothetical protein J2X45_003902 [Caulobacter sp. BE264]|nr:hypothetical protein [Caulobacter sp. BE264]
MPADLSAGAAAKLLSAFAVLVAMAALLWSFV